MSSSPSRGDFFLRLPDDVQMLIYRNLDIWSLIPLMTSCTRLGLLKNIDKLWALNFDRIEALHYSKRGRVNVQNLKTRYTVRGGLSYESVQKYYKKRVISMRAAMGVFLPSSPSTESYKRVIEIALRNFFTMDMYSSHFYERFFGIKDREVANLKRLLMLSPISSETRREAIALALVNNADYKCIEYLSEEDPLLNQVMKERGDLKRTLVNLQRLLEQDEPIESTLVTAFICAVRAEALRLPKYSDFFPFVNEFFGFLESLCPLSACMSEENRAGVILELIKFKFDIQFKGLVFRKAQVIELLLHYGSISTEDRKKLNELAKIMEYKPISELLTPKSSCLVQ